MTTSPESGAPEPAPTDRKLIQPADSPLAVLSARGVSVWLDDLSRELMDGDRLTTLIANQHVVGITSNPTIFASALSKGDLYREQLGRLAAGDADVGAAVLTITTDDVRRACDILRPVFDRTGGQDGRVSIEVQPSHARDTEATLEEARMLWMRVERPNVMIKIPATVEGLEAITQATAEGISVNVTLIFTVSRYKAVMNAYMDGLELAREKYGLDIRQIHSVASFFISRIDAAVDTELDNIGTLVAASLKGQAAVANARMAFQAYEEVIASQRWQELSAVGANPQRPLWASTGVKNKDLPDTYYVQELIAAGTVNTMPGTTLQAFADHGRVPDESIESFYEQAQSTLADLKRVGIDLEVIGSTLETEGLDKFVASWDELGATVKTEMDATARPGTEAGSTA